jgi:mono/diheme cytochrome c family protein
MRSLLIVFLATAGLAGGSIFAADVDFARDIAPILSQQCIKCHGPEKRQGGLRLDTAKLALEGGDAGPAWVAGNSAKSQLFTLISSDDSDERMPKKAPALEAAQIALFKQWIDAGAKWPDDVSLGGEKKSVALWSLKGPQRPAPPAVKMNGWVRNPIDAFTLAKMEAQGLSPSPEASRATLIRRLYLDLTGLLPTPEEADAFIKDSAPDAYEKLVDRLLASPHYGERWGRHWLDAARYADTNGYEKDRERSMWPYRDWVIRAYNDDMPFDRFTVEQLAGDMLPEPTPAQRIATGFHRNTMINEEGGIDYEEFRYLSIVDRVRTTGSVWLGLTMGCAQCHTHKYDPITHKEYWQFFALLNNCDELERAIPDAQIAARRTAIERQVAELEAGRAVALAAAKTPPTWTNLEPQQAVSLNGATLKTLPGGIVTAAGDFPEKDCYEISASIATRNLAALRIEMLADPSLPAGGPGRANNGNYVLSEVQLSVLLPDGTPLPLKLGDPRADVSQKSYDVADAIDGNPSSGWAIDDGSGKINVNHTATFSIENPGALPEQAKLKVRLDQQYGNRHTLGRFRLVLGYLAPQPENETAEARVARMQSEWEAGLAQQLKDWTPLAPKSAVSHKHATMSVLPDASVLVSGDFPNNDVYDLELETPLETISAIRLEVLPDESLPGGGPGRAVMFSRGNFLLTEFEAKAGARDAGELAPVVFGQASQSRSEKSDRTAAKAIDGVIDTGWSVGENTGAPASAVFELKTPLKKPGGMRLSLALHQFYIHQQTIGHFRISVTGDNGPVVASGLPAEIEASLRVPAAQRSPEQAAAIRSHFLSVVPELADYNKKIDDLRRSRPAFPTSLVLAERSPEHERKTQIHHRGEFLSTRAEVEPGVPGVLPQLPKDQPANRLTFARWLVSRENPLTARVTVNRMWYHVFGRGISQTLDDFGVQGETPINPELLDWLSVEFMEPTAALRTGADAETQRAPWSRKGMLRLMLTSATYRQDSRVREETAAIDPSNEWLSHFPRLRVEGEIVRDIGLCASGLLDDHVGGPSIYPPQPDSVTSIAYGDYKWHASQGPSRYRRGVYVYFKRTAPFAAFQTFDAPNANECCVKRNRTNTPLGALAMLNDEMFLEFARAMARRVLAEAPDKRTRVERAFRLAMTRVPDETERAALEAYVDQQREQFEHGADAKAVAGDVPANTQAAELAAWTLLCRTVLNLDEAITRE